MLKGENHRNTKLSFVDLIIIAYPVVIFIERELLPDALPPLKSNAFLYCILFFTGGLLGGSFHFLTSKNRNNNSRHLKTITIPFFILVQAKDYKNKWITFGVVFLSALMNIFVTYIQSFIRKLIGDDTKTKGAFLFDILFILFASTLFSILCLHIRLYKHHYVALAIIFLGVVQLHAITNPLEGKAWLIIPISLAYSMVFGFISICIKYVMNKKLITPFQFAFYYGLVGLILEGLIIAICVIFQIKTLYTEPIFDLPLSFIALFSSVGSVFLVIASLIINTLSFVGKIVILYYCNPICETTSYGLVSVFKWYYLFSTEKLIGSLEIIISITGSICYIIGTYMYFEFIKFYCFGLATNTKEEIANRSLNETISFQFSDLEIVDVASYNTNTNNSLNQYS